MERLDFSLYLYSTIPRKSPGYARALRSPKSDQLRSSGDRSANKEQDDCTKHRYNDAVDI